MSSLGVRMKVLWFDNNWLHHYCVYCLTSPDGKKYFGISRYDASRRWKYGNGYKGNKRLNNEIEKYSFANFRHEIIAKDLYRDDAEQLEENLIRQYDTTDPSKGFNVRKGTSNGEWDVYLFTFPDGKRYVGMTGRSVTARWNSGKGYKHNARLQAAIDAVGFENVKKEHFSYPLTRESAERIETTLIDYFDSANPEKGYNRGHGALQEFGWQHTAEQKELFRQQQTGKPKSAETRRRMRLAHERRPVRCISTGEEFDGVRAAAEAKGISSSGISRACTGSQKEAGGLRWE